MPKTKENKGITLIALIITIIVLLILAGVTISAISGNESVMEKAKQAKELNESSSELEQMQIAAVSAMANGLDGKISAANLKDALEGIVSQEEINKITGNGPWIVKKDEREYKIKDNGEAREYTKSDKINTKIGQLIPYSANGVTSWKVFYADSNEMFIISTNILFSSGADSPTQGLMTALPSNGIPVNESTVADVMGDGTYGRKWNSTWLNTPGVITTQDRHNAIAYLCDKTKWEAYVAKQTNSTTPKLAKSYAVGAPTLELFVASWNIAASSSKAVSLPLETNEYGYGQTLKNGITTSEANAVYNPTGNGIYFLASTHNDDGHARSRVRIVGCDGIAIFNEPYSSTNIGFRPIVSIPISNVEVVDGTETVTINIKDDNGNLIQ